MFLNGHDLDTIISILDDTRQHILLELCIGPNFLRILCHAYMALIDQQRIHMRPKRLLSPLVRLGIPYLRREYLCILILHHALAPCRYPFSFSSVPIDMHFIEIAMFHGLFRQFQLPIACTLNTLCLVFGQFFPIIEISYKIDICCIGSPFTEHPSPSHLMQAEIIIP